MPTYTYACPECEIEFDELLTLREEVQEYAEAHPCPQCKRRAGRVPATFAFSFKGGVRGESGVHGQSGVKDLDYPSLDKAVGRSAEAKWGRYRQRKEERDRVRREAGTNALSQAGDKAVPADARTLHDRERALSLFNRAKKSAG